MGRRRKLQITEDGRKLRLIGDWNAVPLEGLCEATRVARAVDKLQRDLVQQARKSGQSWTEIGEALGVSRQAAWERFSTAPE